MDTFTIAGIKDGKPFAFGRFLLTPRATMAGLEAKAGALKRLSVAPAGLAADVESAIRESAYAVAHMEQANAMLYGCLCQADPALRKKTPDEVLELLSLADYEALIKSLGDGKGSRPLGQTTSTPSTGASG